MAADLNDFFAIFDLQVALILHIKFGVKWPFGSEVQNRFSRWQPSWISDQNHFRYFHLQVTSILPTMFWVNWPFSSGEEVQKRFSRWRPLWISIRYDFSYFWSTSHPYTSYWVSSQLDFPFRSSKKDFQDGGYLGFPIGMILAIFFLNYKSP